MCQAILRETELHRKTNTTCPNHMDSKLNEFEMQLNNAISLGHKKKFSRKEKAIFLIDIVNRILLIIMRHHWTLVMES